MTVKKQGCAKAKQSYQMKISLIDSKPLIWRRILVPTDYHLGNLDMIIQMVMGWVNRHLHDFEINGQQYGNPDYEDEFPKENKDERKFKLAKVVRAGDKFTYTYDFGDGWRHEIIIEEVRDDKSGPVCLGGENACPPEDCGGIRGYYEMLETVKNPDHHDYEEKKTWLGQFDPKKFDLDVVNAALKDFAKDPEAGWSVED
jgi:hypothetical protein